MTEREATEKLLGRMYKQHLKSTGRLPDGRELRGMEQKAAAAAERAERSEKAN